MRSKFAAGLLGLVCAFAVAYPASAKSNPQAASNITVRPFLQDIKISPDQPSKQFILTLTNDSAFKQVFSLSTVNFGSLDQTGGLVFEGTNSKNISGKYGLTKWLSLDRNDIQLDAKSQTTITATIRNDSDLAPGAHYAAIITTASRPASAVGQLTVTPKVSSLVFATKIGGEIYDIHLASIHHNGNLWQPPNSVSLNLKSTGNTYITPRGNVWLRQGGKTIAHGIINAQSALVLPGQTRNFDVPLTKVTNFKTSLVVSKYKIQVDYRYDGNQNFATHTYDKLYISKLGLILVAFILIIVGLAIVSRQRRWPKRLVHKLKK